MHFSVEMVRAIRVLGPTDPNHPLYKRFGKETAERLGFYALVDADRVMGYYTDEDMAIAARILQLDHRATIAMEIIAYVSNSLDDGVAVKLEDVVEYIVKYNAMDQPPYWLFDIAVRMIQEEVDRRAQET